MFFEDFENRWWKEQESLVSNSDETLVVICPCSDMTNDELILLGNRLNEWQRANKFVRHIWGLGNLLEGCVPRTPPIYLMIPFIGKLAECYEQVALVFVEKGIDHEIAINSLRFSIGELISRLAWLCPPEKYESSHR
jgi:hypothetical protein